MKSNLKKIVAFTALAALSSMGFAKDYFGIYLLGGQYTLEDSFGKDKDLRVNLGVPFAISGGGASVFSISGGADVITALDTTPSHPYWGVGTQLNLASASASSGSSSVSSSVLSIAPMGTYGYDFNGFFVEGSLGMQFIFSETFALFPAVGIRLGYNFK